jgi:maltooligosyltrehalose trehalohydrolase
MTFAVIAASKRSSSMRSQKIVREMQRAGGRSRVHSMPFGAKLEPDGKTRFQLWAPAQARVRAELEGDPALLELERDDTGWHTAITDRAGAGTRYRFVLDDDARIADPASRFQPDDVDGPSEVIDAAAHVWLDGSWRGRPWIGAVLYELHVGAFTPDGTFRAAAEKLAHLVRLGVTAIELMPIADFPGRRNWGYDGVFLFAPDSSYGRPEDLKAFVDAAHACGLMVLLDVVYNHFGPHGNSLPMCSDDVFTPRHHTPWGDALNYDGPGSRPIRELVIHNALYWLEEFHVDGLRLDAVHAILDDSPEHLLHELARRVRDATRGREIHLIIENEDNAAGLIGRSPSRSTAPFEAQWNDDVHHVLHVAATGERAGYYADYHGDPVKLGRALAEGFAYQGETMPFRGSARGEPSAALPPGAFVAFLQNHDQIGNRAFGERLARLASPEALRAISAVHLLLPQVPLLFMGEEWGAQEPFPFFCDFAGRLGEAVRQGRREEFARFPEFADPLQREKIPDPQADSTFESAKLRWSDADTDSSAQHSERYRALLGVRRRWIAPLAAVLTRGGSYRVIAPGAVSVEWQSRDGALILVANLTANAVDAEPPRDDEIWREGDVSPAGRYGPWSVRWAVRGHG